MKENIFIEFQGKKVERKQLIDSLKALWVEQGNKVKDLKIVDLYYKPEESMCYYVINNEITGSFAI